MFKENFFKRDKFVINNSVFLGEEGNGLCFLMGYEVKYGNKRSFNFTKKKGIGVFYILVCILIEKNIFRISIGWVFYVIDFVSCCNG